MAGWVDRMPCAAALAGLCLAAMLCGASAQEPNSAFDDVMERLQLKAKVAPAEDFVTKSRPKADAGFIPVGTAHPARSIKVMTPAEVAATEASLDATRERVQRGAGLKPAPVPLKGQKTAAAKKTRR